MNTDRPYIAWPRILHGGDYNPDQWPPEVWEEDAKLMAEANVNVATVPVFGWAALEPEEGRYQMEWLDRVFDILAAKDVDVCLATSTASQPAWVDEQYPDVLIVDADGFRRRHGGRHSFCPNSANYRRLSTAMVRQLALRYKDRPNLRLWHMNNEYGTICYCDKCAAAFRIWLQAKYGSLDELNRRWYTSFWGHTYTSWTQVEPPYHKGEGSIQALKIDYHRFQSECLLECYKAEAAVAHAITPGVPVTTNLMGHFFNLDYHKWAEHLDVATWDNYPRPNADPAHIAFVHALMRGLKGGQPFMLMEQSPSQQNWQPYNRLKPPGQLRLQSFQTVAHGADAIMYFQWRRGRGGIEKLHGAVVEHGGTSQNRVFQEVRALGQDLKNLGTQTIGGWVPAKVVVLFSWENWWALRYSSGPSVDLDYVEIVRSFYSAFHRLGIQVDVLSPDADLSKYKVIVAPLLYMVTPEQGQRLVGHVKDGAALVATFFSGMADDCDTVYREGSPGPLSEALGIWVEETDALPPDTQNGIRWVDGEEAPSRLICDRIHLRGATAIGAYTKEFYAGEPAVSKNACGQGWGYYLASMPDDASLESFLSTVCRKNGIDSPLAEGAKPPFGLEVTQRISPTGKTLTYLLNHGADTVEAALPKGGKDLLTGAAVNQKVQLAPKEVLIVEMGE